MGSGRSHSIWQSRAHSSIAVAHIGCWPPNRILKASRAMKKMQTTTKNATTSRFLVWNRIVKGAFNGGTTRAVCPGGILTLSSSIRFSTGYIAALSRLKWCTCRGIGPGAFGCFSPLRLAKHQQKDDVFFIFFYRTLVTNRYLQITSAWGCDRFQWFEMTFMFLLLHVSFTISGAHCTVNVQPLITSSDLQRPGWLPMAAQYQLTEPM